MRCDGYHLSNPSSTLKPTAAAFAQQRADNLYLCSSRSPDVVVTRNVLRPPMAMALRIRCRLRGMKRARCSILPMCSAMQLVALAIASGREPRLMGRGHGAGDKRQPRCLRFTGYAVEARRKSEIAWKMEFAIYRGVNSLNFL